MEKNFPYQKNMKLSYFWLLATSKTGISLKIEFIV